jgi:MerR family copper efflux transcriptional regulator
MSVVDAVDAPDMSTMVTIGQAAQRSGVPAKTIRYYESIGLVRPARGENKYRAYGDSEVETLRFINRARALGFTLKEVHALLALYRDRRRSSRDVKKLALRHVEQLDRKIDELTAIRNAVLELARHCRGDERPDCPILDDLGAVTLSLPDAQSRRDDRRISRRATRGVPGPWLSPCESSGSPPNGSGDA